MLTAVLENLLNRGLPRSPRARTLCAELAGKSVAVEMRDLTRLTITSTGLTLALSAGDAPADATLSGVSRAVT
jgi:ubiquinone biosynthesis protein UbiJ